MKKNKMPKGYSISNFHKVHPFFRFCWKLAHIFYNIKLRYPENFSLIGPAVWKLQLSKDWSIWRKIENYYVFGPRLWIRFPKKAMDQSLKYCLSIYTSLGATCLPKFFWGPALLPLKMGFYILVQRYPLIYYTCQHESGGNCLNFENH